VCCLFAGDKFQGFDGGGAATDNGDLLPFCTLTVQFGAVPYLSFEIILSWEGWHLWVATCPNCGNYAVEASVAGVVNDPTALRIFVDFIYACVEFCFGVEAVAFP
jgi:hypothetical protein